MAIVIRPKLDRTEVQIDIPNHLVSDVLQGIKTLAGRRLAAPDFVSSPNIAKMSVPFFEDKNGAGLRLILLTAYKRTYLKYDFNPNRIPSLAFRQFVVDSLDLGIGSYSAALTYGKLRSFELAIDCIGVHSTSLLVHRPYITAPVFMQSSGQLGGTQYFGHKESNCQIKIYDKGEEQLACGTSGTYSRLLRIEARYHRENVSCAKIEDVPNRFHNLVICPIKTLYSVPVEEPAIWKQFLTRAQVTSVAQALSKFPLKDRKRFLALLRANQATWWCPSALMTTVKETVWRQLQYRFAIDCKG